MKNKLKWFYDQQYQESYTLETYPWANDGFLIKNEGYGYELYRGGDFKFKFKYKKNAIKVAELIVFG